VKVADRTDCWTLIVGTVTEVLEERGDEPGELTPATMLNADLGISSVDAIHIVIMLEDRLGIPLSFETLAVKDGEYVEDLALSELLRFVEQSVSGIGS
jgi:acyl carrier protein